MDETRIVFEWAVAVMVVCSAALAGLGISFGIYLRWNDS